MSRSYKKPIIKDHNKGMKNFANRKIRRMSVDKEIADGRSYRKYFDRYNICDYIYHWSPYSSYHFREGVIMEIKPEPKWRYNSK